MHFTNAFRMGGSNSAPTSKFYTCISTVLLVDIISLVADYTQAFTLGCKTPLCLQDPNQRTVRIHKENKGYKKL